MHSPDRAILLVAGRGRRLEPVNDGRPKCLVEVAGRPILDRALRSLSQCGVGEAVLVTGHRGDAIRQAIGREYAGVEIKYVDNPRHLETSTAYSVWLARAYLTRRCFLIEGDIVFDEEALERILGSTDGGSVWAGIPVGPGLSEGILLQGDEGGRIPAVTHVGRAGDPPEGFEHKCGGIQALSQSLARAFAAELDSQVPNGAERAFADQVLGELLPSHPVVLCSLARTRWAEVDTPDDLTRARRIFAEKKSLSQSGSS